MNEADWSFLIYISMILFMFTIGLIMFKKVNKQEPNFEPGLHDDKKRPYLFSKFFETYKYDDNTIA